MSDPRFDLRMRGRVPPLLRPTYAEGRVLRVESLPIIPPPLRRETAQPRPAWRPGDVVLPALDDDGDLPTLASQMDHVAAEEP